MLSLTFDPLSASATNPSFGFLATIDKNNAFKSSLLAPFLIKSLILKTPSSNKQFLKDPVAVTLILLQSSQIVRVNAGIIPNVPLKSFALKFRDVEEVLSSNF